jgi:O-methyltransferase
MSPRVPSTESSRTPDLYLDLLKRALTYSLWDEPPAPIARARYQRGLFKGALVRLASWLAARRGWQIVERRPNTEEQRQTGQLWPMYAHTMIGRKRLDSLQRCVEQALDRGVPGDLIETGVWRGGACILMRGVLEARGVTSRRVFVADSFCGLPDTTGCDGAEFLAVPRAEVEDAFRRYGLLNEQVVFLEGWFKDTLPKAPLDRLAVMRLDGDLYESTLDALEALYPKLSPGGFCVIDDYAIEGARRAVADYRRRHGVTEEIVPIDQTGVYWQRARAGVVPEVVHQAVG